ncbi:hypothetical protein RZS08_57755, partial [Arthrospira platensis SPKY1]|nr:hypothetical protein [Arthrospira platensis SPKY1]
EHFMSFAYKKPVVKALKRTRLALKMLDYYFKIYSYLYFNDSPFDTDPSYTIYQGLDVDEIKSITRKVHDHI